MTNIYAYAANSGRLTVQASAHSSTAGFLWLLNPVGSTKTLKIRRVGFSSSPTAATVFTSSPRVSVERMTFTVVSGYPTAIAAGKRLTSDPTATGLAVTTTAGLTPAAGSLLHAFLVPAVLTAVGISEPIEQLWEPVAEDEAEFGPGEGLVIRQPDAGTTSDTRLVTVNIDWQEHDT